MALLASVASAMPMLASAQSLPGPPMSSRDRAIACMTAAIAYEARYESVEGQEAVAEVILNRVRHPAFPKTVCGVVFAGSTRRTGCQFTFTCDGSMARQLRGPIMATARSVAESVLDGRSPARAGGATHYHASYVSPYWAPSLVRVTKIGAHIFYRAAGGPDRGLVQLPYYAANEPVIASLGMAGPPEPESANTAALNRPAPLQPARFSPWGLALPSAGN